MFTKISKNFEDPDDIGIEGLEPNNKYDDVDLFKELVAKFKKELSVIIHKDLDGKQSLEIVELKVDLILPDDHFYAFKIFKEKERLELEK